MATSRFNNLKLEFPKCIYDSSYGLRLSDFQCWFAFLLQLAVQITLREEISSMSHLRVVNLHEKLTNADLERGHKIKYFIYGR